MSKTTSKIKFGIIGFGRYAENRLVTAFRLSHRADLIAINKRDPEQAKLKAERYGIPYFYSDPGELVRNEEVQAVAVCSPPGEHLVHTRLAAEAGKHVIVEKPLAANARQAAEMVEICRSNGVLLMSALVMRFIEAVQYVRKIVSEGGIGEVKYAAGHFTLNAALSPRTWLNDPGLSGGGPVADIGVHILDLLQFILNEPIIGVKSILSLPFTAEHIERRAIVALQFKNGTSGSLFVSFDLPRETSLLFMGSKGRVKVLNFNRINEEVAVRLVHEGQETVVPVRNGYYYRKMIDHFCEAIENGKALLTPGEVGLHNQNIIDAIYRDGLEPGKIYGDN